MASGTDSQRSTRPSRVHYPLISIPEDEVFRYVLARFLLSTMAPETPLASQRNTQRPGLKKIPPYWYPYTTMAKGRWLGREILEVVSTEFRDRSVEYYVRKLCYNARCVADRFGVCQGQRYALESGVTTINGKVAKPATIVRNGDRIEYVSCCYPCMHHSEVFILGTRNVVHRHEPPVTATPVRIVHHDKERGFLVIDKPGSIVRTSIDICHSPGLTSTRTKPVHAAGRYFRNSLVEILKNDFGFEKVYSIYQHFYAVHLAFQCLLSNQQIGPAYLGDDDHPPERTAGQCPLEGICRGQDSQRIYRALSGRVS